MMLIFRFGAMGAVVGTILAEGVVAIYQTIKVKDELDIKKYILESAVYIIPAVIMCMILQIIYKIMGVSIITAVTQIIVGGIIYIVLSAILMYLNKDEIIFQLIEGVQERLKRKKVISDKL